MHGTVCACVCFCWGEIYFFICAGVWPFFGIACMCVLMQVHVCICVYLCVFVFEPELDSQQCLITAPLRSNGLQFLHITHSIYCSLTDTYTLPHFSFFLTETCNCSLSLSHIHTPIHSVPPYSPAPHSWAWGSSSDIWASQPAALLNSTCQAEQKHPPPSWDQWQSFPPSPFSLSSSITISASFAQPNHPFIHSFFFMQGQVSVLYNAMQWLQLLTET